MRRRIFFGFHFEKSDPHALTSRLPCCLTAGKSRSVNIDRCRHRVSLLLCCRDGFLIFARISASVLTADQKILSLLAEEHLAAIGAILGYGHIPRREITCGIFFTAVEHGVIASELCDDLRRTLGAVDTGLSDARLGKAALGILTASVEATELSGAQHHIGAALFALEIGDDNRLLLFRCLFPVLLAFCGRSSQGVLVVGRSIRLSAI